MLYGAISPSKMVYTTVIGVEVSEVKYHLFYMIVCWFGSNHNSVLRDSLNAQDYSIFHHVPLPLAFFMKHFGKI